MPRKYDFSGWATKANMLCSDGRTIMKDAFKDCDGKKVPLLWNHQHNDPNEVLGHAILENRDEGVYAYASFNDTENGQLAKAILKHGDIESLSIWANNLKQKNGNVVHGVIREVSLVLAGANPGAFIDSVIAHSANNSFDEEAAIFSGEEIELFHSDNMEDYEMSAADVYDEMTDEQKDAVHELVGHALEDAGVLDDDDSDEEYVDEGEDLQHSDDYEEEYEDYEGESDYEEDFDEENEDMYEDEVYEDDQFEDEFEHSADDLTVEEVFDSMTDEQKTVVYAMVGQALEDAGVTDDDEDGGNEMKHNVFENEYGYDQDDFLCHADQMTILEAAKKDRRSLRETINDFYGEEEVLAHSIDTTGMDTPVGQLTYGFNDPSMLFPEYRSLDKMPQWIQRDQSWVSKVMGGVHKSPFSRIKSVFADITEPEARAKGYVTGSLKVEEVFSTLRRTTDPQTIYKKQKMDRDNIIDITDFNVVEWIKAEMRVMLNEEVARAILIGDGRSALASDKIKEDHIRPIVSDVPLFNVKVPVTISKDYSDVIKAIIRARKNYKGSGNPTFFTTEDVITEMLLLEDGIGRPLYDTLQALATKLRVKEIVPVEAMEGYKITVDNEQKDLIGVIVNLTDYNVGTDKGGEINYFDDFDIDYNQEKYLIETRMSGALVKPFSAMTVYIEEGNSNP